MMQPRVEYRIGKASVNVCFVLIFFIFGMNCMV